MTRFFKTIPGKNKLEECSSSNEAEFIEIHWNHVSWAVPMVLSLNDAIQRFNNRFRLDSASNTWFVDNPSTWIALFEHNKDYCSEQHAKVLSEATLAIRPN